ncbi:MAG TPA: ATP-dependent 6-phosphofructokinase [Spirochaetota bacterium]|nr:ATP-dependent 6-phosphofructokinase [Spirochaetota bacterium]
MPTTIKNLGQCTVVSPLAIKYSQREAAFINDAIRVRFNAFIGKKPPPGGETIESFEAAGPREKIFFNPETTRVAITTCGGLSPGINDVIRSLVMESYYGYGINDIIGIPYGYNGLNPEYNYTPIPLNPDNVKSIHMQGGSILGSSRGGTRDMDKLVDTLQKLNVSILYTIGGDGTLRGSHDIAMIALQRGLPLAAVGIPKTIDNDISFIQRSFGFETAFSIAVEAIYAAHTEAIGAPNGIGLVKLMGRHSGFIAANAALASNDVNFVLLPEVPFELYGANGLCAHLENRLQRRGHAVICVAEGAGQEILQKDSDKQYDASGNVKLADIGVYLKEKIQEYFKQKEIEINLKYIDPSYMIRSAPAVPNDSIYCTLLGQNAVHAGMAGKTDLVIGQWSNIYTHVPVEVAISKRKRIDPHSRFYSSVLDATGQPFAMINK